MPIKHSSRGLKVDRKRRSAQALERGDGAPRKSNPRYTPKIVKDKNGVKRKVYVLRKNK